MLLGLYQPELGLELESTGEEPKKERETTMLGLPYGPGGGRGEKESEFALRR